jgi:hypothetical protein
MRSPFKVTLLALAILPVLLRAALPHTEGVVDRTFTQAGDITGDGSAETITLHVGAEKITTPFRWSLTITRGTAVIYHVERNDASQDSFFKDEGYVQRCSGYVDCKERYYFVDLPARIFSGLKPTLSPWRLDEFTLKNLQETAGDYLRQHQVPREKVPVAIAEMVTILNTPPFHVLVVPQSATTDSAPMIWVPGVEQFVPFYQE